MFVNGTGPQVLEKKNVRVLQNPGIWSLLVPESPGKKHFNVCTNPDMIDIPRITTKQGEHAESVNVS